MMKLPVVKQWPMLKGIKIYSFMMAFSLLPISGFAQAPIDVALTYSKLADNTVQLDAAITDSEESEPLENVEIEFFSHLDSARVSLGTATSNQDGMAVLGDIPFSKLLLSTEHQFHLTYEVKGDFYVDAPEQFTYSEVDMQISFEEIDSVKQIVATLSSWDTEGNPVPVEELDAYLYVPRLFSLLPIGDVYTDEEGRGTAKFPTDLPGGKNGELEVILKIEDHENFGNVAVSEIIDWGLPGQPEVSTLPRALWSPDAPLWMWITFIILMVAVWFHYGWILVNLLKIKSLGSDVDSIIYED